MAEEHKTTEAQKRATMKYQAQSMRLYSFRLSKNTDADMIEYLDSVDNRTGTIKAAIREKMERGGEENEKEI